MTPIQPGVLVASHMIKSSCISFIEKVDLRQEAQWKVIPSIQVKPSHPHQREPPWRGREGWKRRRRGGGRRWRRRRGCCHLPKSQELNSAPPPSNQRWDRNGQINEKFHPRMETMLPNCKICCCLWLSKERMIFYWRWRPSSLGRKSYWCSCWFSQLIEYSVPDEEASSKEQRDGIRPNKAGDFLSDWAKHCGCKARTLISINYSFFI